MNKSYDLLRRARLALGLYKKVSFEDPYRMHPVSRLFGTDRGKPVDRYYIEKFLEGHRESIHGRILEVAEDTYSRRFADPAGNPVFEILNPRGRGDGTSFTGDLTRFSTLPGGRYDCFICTQTLNFIPDAFRAVEGIRQLLKPGGVALVTVAGISQISRYDMERWGDYWRFTDRSARLLFEGPFGKGGMEITTCGNVMAAKAMLDGLAVEDLPEQNLLDVTDPDYQVIVAIKAIRQ